MVERIPECRADPWNALRGLTSARVGLERAGDTVAGAQVRKLQAAHARARRAVHAGLDPESLRLDSPAITVKSRASDRSEFVRRPDLGRRLAEESRGGLTHGGWDVVFVMADGLSALAVERQAPAVFRAARKMLAGWCIAPIVLAHNARVALGDEIGAALGARSVVMMIGERPGLSVSDGLSLYMTWMPRLGRMDAERNCISNIHEHGGLSPDDAAARLVWLLEQARERGCSGVALKDESVAQALLPPAL